jgi:hypothetical protein
MSGEADFGEIAFQGGFTEFVDGPLGVDRVITMTMVIDNAFDMERLDF